MTKTVGRRSDDSLRAARALSKLAFGGAGYRVEIGAAIARAAASTGVQFVSVGALTHSAPALDLSLTMEPL